MLEKNSAKKANALFFVIVLASIILNELIYAFNKYFHIQFTYFQILLIAQITYALPALVYIGTSGRRFREVIRLKKVNSITVALLVLFAFAIRPLMNLISVLSLLVAKNQIGATVDGMLLQSNFFLVLIAVAVVPAILEEVVYRGVIYHEQRKVSVIKGALCSALFFGLLHMNINQFSYAFVMGIIFVLVVEAVDSIWGSMIVHFIINGWSVCFAKIQPYIMEKLAEQSPEMVEKVQETVSKQQIIELLPTYAINAVVGTIVAVGIYWLIVKYNHRKESIKEILKASKQNKQKEQFIDWFFIVAVGICVVIMVATELNA